MSADHVHLLVSIRRKLSVSGLMGVLKDVPQYEFFTPFHFEKNLIGNHFWARVTA